MPVIGDYDGDGLSDVAVFHAGHRFLGDTATGAIRETLFGQAGDVALIGDFDGDGKDDLLLWRQAEGIAYARSSREQNVQALPWGRLQPGESLLIGDYDGDGKAEPAVWRVVKATWEVLLNQTRR